MSDSYGLKRYKVKNICMSLPQIILNLLVMFLIYHKKQRGNFFHFSPKTKLREDLIRSWVFYKRSKKSEINRESQFEAVSITIEHLLIRLKALFLRRHMGFSYSQTLMLNGTQQIQAFLEHLTFVNSFCNPILKTQLLNGLLSPFPVS